MCEVVTLTRDCATWVVKQQVKVVQPLALVVEGRPLASTITIHCSSRRLTFDLFGRGNMWGVRGSYGTAFSCSCRFRGVPQRVEPPNAQ